MLKMYIYVMIKSKCVFYLRKVIGYLLWIIYGHNELPHGYYSTLAIKENNRSIREQTWKLLPVLCLVIVSRNANSVWLIPFEATWVIIDYINY